MVTLLLYAYCVGVTSPRKIGAAYWDQVLFRFIMAGVFPDHTTIARFRAKHSKALARVLTDSLVLCQVAGLASVAVVALDGTKMRANAAKSATVGREAIGKQVDAMMKDAKATDAAEDKVFGKDQRGDEPPTNLRDPTKRRERLAAVKAKIAAAEAAEAAEAAAHATHLA